MKKLSIHVLAVVIAIAFTVPAFAQSTNTSSSSTTTTTTPAAPGTSAGTTVLASDCDLLARTKALAVMHKAYAVTGGICVGAAALIEGTVVNEVVAPRAKTAGVVRVGHPSGVSEFVITVVRKPSG